MLSLVLNSSTLSVIRVMAAGGEVWKRNGVVRGVGIPSPSGQYSVGCVSLMHLFPGETDTLLVRLFYPTSQLSGEYTKWVPNRRYTKGYFQYSKVKAPGLISTLISPFIDPRVPALVNASLVSNDAQLPVCVFSHGLGAMSFTYSAICCDLASHGYVVASVEHRDGSACMSHLRVPSPSGTGLTDKWLEHRFLSEGEKEFPIRNEQVKHRSMDAQRALDLLVLLNSGQPVGNLLGADMDFTQFKGRLDLNTVGMMGHSFGGATTLQTLYDDQRFKCGVCLDTWMLPIHKELYEQGSAVRQPIIFINSHDFQWKENIEQMQAMTLPSNKRGMSPARILTLIGTNHFYQCDVLFLFPPWISFSPRSTLDMVVGHRVNMDVTHAFLNRHLLNIPSYQGPIPDLDGGEGHSPHILFGTNVKLSDSPTSEQPVVENSTVPSNL